MRHMWWCIPLAGCVKGTPVETHLPAELMEFEATPKGWCGPCTELTVKWSVKNPAEDTEDEKGVEVTVSFEGQVVKTWTDSSGEETYELCGNTTGAGGSGTVKIAAAGLEIVDDTIELQQTLDGEVKILDFPPLCPYNGLWADELGYAGPYSDELWPASIQVDRIRNWTYYDTNGNGAPDAGEKAPKIKITHETLQGQVVQDTWLDVQPPVRLQGPWSAEPENVDTLGKRCPAEDAPVITPDDVIPLRAQVRIRCAE